jgi:hypothetical protein
MKDARMKSRIAALLWVAAVACGKDAATPNGGADSSGSSSADVATLDGGSAAAARAGEQAESGSAGAEAGSSAGAGGTAGASGTGGSTTTADAGPDADDDAGTLDPLCDLPPDTGPCDALIGRYFHDPATRSCERFTYGGCSGNDNNFEVLTDCERACDVSASTPCSIEVEDPALPGVRLRVEGDRCRVRTGREHEFRYTLVVDQAITYTAFATPSCGKCGGYSDDPLSLVDYSIGGGDTWYCLCDVGCCPPTSAVTQTLQTGTFEGVIVWPGRAWNGPSDTAQPLGPPFAPGDYNVSVTFDIPSGGALTARLPIEVFGEPPDSDASCEVGGRVYASGDEGIDDPQSCNTCACADGALVCTEIACPEPCPDGTAFGTSCSRCGPADSCEVVRHACLPTCDANDDCTGGGICTQGQCRNLCG